jgi:hypothetical protein
MSPRVEVICGRQPPGDSAGGAPRVPRAALRPEQRGDGDGP